MVKTPPILKTIFRAEITPSLVFELVEYTDTRLGIHRNGHVIPPGSWVREDLDRCIDAFRELCRAHEPQAKA